MSVQFIYDYRSIYAYLTNSQMPGLGVKVEYQLVDIVEVMRLVGNQPTPKCPTKARYARLDSQRWADIYGINLAPNDQFFADLNEGRITGSYLLRVALASQQLGIFEAVNNAIFSAVWAGSDDLTSSQGRKAFGLKYDIPEEIWRLADTVEIHSLLAENTQSAVAAGVFGAPSFIVGGELYFGNDRLSFVKDRLKNGAEINV